MIFLAAVEARAHSTAAALEHAPNVLSSFYYAPSGDRLASWYACLQHAKRRFIDSGAYTLRTAGTGSGRGAQNAHGEIDFDKYLREYIEWLKPLVRRQLADVWVEVDISAIAGASWLHAQRQAFIRAGLGHGLLNVWHGDTMGWQDWLDMLAEASQPGRSRYVAIEGRTTLDYGKFLHAAYEAKVRVHCFKMTENAMMEKHPFYSVDSSSWTAVERWGARAAFGKTPDGALVARSSQVTQRLACTDAVAWAGAQIKKNAKHHDNVSLLRRSARLWIRRSDELDAMWRTRGVDWRARLGEQ